MSIKNLYYNKYLKYKNKYLNLKNQIGGTEFESEDITMQRVLKLVNTPLDKQVDELTKMKKENNRPMYGGLHLYMLLDEANDINKIIKDTTTMINDSSTDRTIIKELEDKLAIHKTEFKNKLEELAGYFDFTPDTKTTQGQSSQQDKAILFEEIDEEKIFDQYTEE